MSVAASAPRFCSVYAQAQGDDPLGSAWAMRRMLALELALPWPNSYFEAREFPAGLGATLEALWEDYPDTGMLAFAPDPAHARPGFARVIDYRYPEPPHAAAARREYLVPHPILGEFFAGIFVDDPAALALPGVESVAYTGRDLFVCTHGTVDVCCAKFGYPLYRALHSIAAERPAGDVRVWRASHFGGHRFAATLIDWPEGRFWGFMTPDSGRALIERTGDAAALRGRYRGWSGHASEQAQRLEGEALMREGWAWTTWPQRIEELGAPEPGVSRFRLTASPPDAPPVVYEGEVAEAGERSVLHSTGAELDTVMAYEVRDLRRLPAATDGDD
ncbi:MAG: sucrase ferredoxin [Thermomicrobiales bacterium]